MPTLEVIERSAIFRNPLPGHRIANGYLPHVLDLDGGELLSVYRMGSAFYSIDGTLHQARSTDGGKTWRDSGPVWDPKLDSHPYSYSGPFLAKFRDKTLVLVALRVDASDPERLLVNPNTGAFAPMDAVVLQSPDNGQTWSKPQAIELPKGMIAYLAGPVVELQNGEWFVPFDNGKAYDDPNPVKPVMYGFFSPDRGRTWGEQTSFADGAPQKKSHCHGRVVPLLDGRLFTLLWTRDDSADRFVDLHRTVADPTGRTWDIPQPTGVVGQTSWAADLGNNRMFAAYTTRELKPPGIRGVLSEDGGKTWATDQEVILWDATGRETIGVAAKDAYPVSHDVIAFGRPQAQRAENGDVLVSFWGTEASLTQARFCRIRVH